MSVKTDLQPHLKTGGLSGFVASPDKRAVPNHLLDTKIFCGISDNELFHCRPSAIHFKGFGAGKGKYTQKLKIINVSSECQRVHIIPPSSTSFKIKYNKVDSLVPGMYLDVIVEFAPRENVYHYDCIRVHCKGDRNNLTVPIHAYLTMDLSSFPSNIHFKPTQVGHTAVKKIPLRNSAAIDFEFQISFLQNNAVFQISPVAGIVPANRDVEILVKYSPNEYCTACANIQLVVSQFNCQPHHCYITGTCEPGIASKVKMKQMESAPGESLDPRSLSPLYRSQARKQTDLGKSLKKSEAKEMVQDGIRFPPDMNGHSAVSYVLSQKPGKLKAKDLREAVNQGKGGDDSSKQMKEAVFEHLVTKSVTEEERNQLRWGVKLGDCSMSNLHSQDVDRERLKSADEYLVLKGENKKDQEFSQRSTKRENGRISRMANVQVPCEPTFDLFLNDDWQKRHMILGRFIQAARKTIWIARAQRSLKAMNAYLQEWRSGNFKNTRKTFDEDNRELSIMERSSIDTVGTKLYAFSFPRYNNKAQDDMAVDALGMMSVNETVIVPKTQVCMYSLEVPLQYKLLHYNVHPFSTAVSNYVPTKLARKLKSEFEDEKITTSVMDEVQFDEENLDNIGAVNQDKPQIPAYLLEPETYHEMHIFNPLPGVRAHPEKIPYSEIDDDHTLTPLSRAMPKSLDRDGGIPGVMQWKKFPVHGLVAMSNTPSLYHVYVPRWSDPFSEELVPTKTPELLTSLDPEDVIDGSTASDDPVCVPNMSMVNAEFTMVENLTQTDDADTSLAVASALPNSNNPQSKLGMVSREKMQSDLNVYLQKQMNNLGKSVKLRVSQMQSKWDLDNLN